VAKQPNPELLKYVYPLYFNLYAKMENFQMVIEYAGKTLAFGSKLEGNEKYAALNAWVFGYNSLDSEDTTLAAKAVERSSEGFEVVSKVEKPECVNADTFELQRNLVISTFARRLVLRR
jgi:hypothetical protein